MKLNFLTPSVFARKFSVVLGSVIRLTVHSAYKNMPQFNVRRIMLDHKQAAKSPLVQKFMDKCTSACDLLASFPMVSRHRTYDQDNQDLLPGSSARINNLLAKKSLKAQSCVNFKSFIFCFQFVRL